MHPEVPPEGVPLEDLFRGREAYVEDSKRRLKRAFEAEGLPYQDIRHVPNTRVAQEVGKWAESQPGGEAFHEAVFRAYFGDGRDIGDPLEVLAIAGECGLDESDARAALGQRAHRGEVDADWKRAVDSAIWGVPYFVAGEATVMGCQTHQVLAQLVERAGARRR